MKDGTTATWVLIEHSEETGAYEETGRDKSFIYLRGHPLDGRTLSTFEMKLPIDGGKAQMKYKDGVWLGVELGILEPNPAYRAEVVQDKPPADQYIISEKDGGGSFTRAIGKDHKDELYKDHSYWYYFRGNKTRPWLLWSKPAATRSGFTFIRCPGLSITQLDELCCPSTAVSPGYKRT